MTMAQKLANFSVSTVLGAFNAGNMSKLMNAPTMLATNSTHSVAVRQLRFQSLVRLSSLEVKLNAQLVLTVCTRLNVTSRDFLHRGGVNKR